MTTLPLLPGVTSQTVDTSRLKTHLLEAGTASSIPVVLVHGNVSSARFFEETLSTLSPKYHGIAPDLRSFGDSAALPIDARRGLRDFADDVAALVSTLGLTGGAPVHFVGWSMGAGVVMQYALDHPQNVASVTLISPLSPFGYGGTKDAAGTLCWPDGAGSGGGTANPLYVKLLESRDRGSDSPNSPRNVLNSLYFKPPFRVAPEREELLVDEIFKMRIGEDFYPGDSTPSGNWPLVAPGNSGINNAMAPTHCHLAALASLTPKPPILWIRGADDQIVSDTSLLDFGTLGTLGYVPGWPGEETFPSQPMVSQMRAVLDAYRQNGGSYQEVVFSDCGHSPLIEKPGEFRETLFEFLGG